MASTPHGYPNILKDTELLLIVEAAMMVRATRYTSNSAAVSIQWHESRNAFQPKGTNEKSQNTVSDTTLQFLKVNTLIATIQKLFGPAGPRVHAQVSNEACAIHTALTNILPMKHACLMCQTLDLQT
ncbi:hypothetical protein AVEN_98777-1 [Araneus ventricosus]|uniref:Uncharacterized protein n=1 Tax=Araneus ventricosus TaxID=182803 RepID=A0A4Y2LEF4_ARAVE|nr:hypothetical protein AVEN_98777-1 [Araneus ventricosus]